MSNSPLSHDFKIKKNLINKPLKLLIVTMSANRGVKKIYNLQLDHFIT